jgi:hypothetical protein
MSKEFNVFDGWVRNFKGDVPQLIGDQENLATGSRNIPQQVGFLTPNGTEVQMNFDRAEKLGMLDEGDTRWSIPIVAYIKELET